MGIASIVIGVLAAVFAMIGTASFLGFVLLLGILAGAVGLLLGLGEFVRAAIHKTRGITIDRELLGAARSGFVTNLIAMLWSIGAFAFKGPM
jgi:hypothetical protein